MDDLAFVRYFATRSDAEMAADILKQHHIPSMLQSRGNIQDTYFNHGATDLFVRAFKLSEAQAILDDYFPPSAPTESTLSRQ